MVGDATRTRLTKLHGFFEIADADIQFGV